MSIDDGLTVFPPDLDLDGIFAIRDTEVVIMRCRWTIGDVAWIIDADIAEHRRFGLRYPDLAAIGLEVRRAVAQLDGDANLPVVQQDRHALDTATHGLTVDGLRFVGLLFRGWDHYRWLDDIFGRILHQAGVFLDQHLRTVNSLLL